MMNKKSMLVLSCLWIMIVAVPSAMSFDILALHDNLYVKSIDALRITSSGQPTLNILMTLQNDSDKTVRIKNGLFKIVIKPNNAYKVDEAHGKLAGNYSLTPFKQLPLGVSKIAVGSDENTYYVSRLENFEVNQGSAKTAIFQIPLPTSPDQRYAMIVKLVNYIGLPGSFSKIEMVGKATVGVKGTRGWAYQDLSLLELFYIPKLQSEVLFE